MITSKKNKFSLLILLTVLFSISFNSLQAQDTQGILKLDLKPFVSEIKLKKKILKQLESGALEWGVTGNQFVTTLANKRFINFDFPYMTRYGTSKEIQLAPGKYEVSCIGFIYNGGMNVDKVLEKGAFFNLDVLSFEIFEGKTTTLEILPIIEKSRYLMLKMYMPNLIVKVIENDEVKAEKSVSEKTENSIEWNDYEGELKFKK